MEIQIEFIIVIFCLSSGFAFVLGSLISPRTKNLKQDIKYLEGKYNRLRQDTKDKDEGGFDLGSLLGGGSIGDILKFVEKNPGIIQKVLGSLTPPAKSPGYELR